MKMNDYLIIAIIMAFIIILLRLAAPFVKSEEVIKVLSWTDIIARISMVMSLLYYISFKLLGF